LEYIYRNKKIFKSILSSRINKRTDNTKIKNKAATLGGGAGEENQESTSESCRVVSKLTPGMIEEINWSCDSPAFIVKQLPKAFTCNIEIVNTVYRTMISHSKEAPFIVPDSTFVLLGWIYQSCLNHYDSFKYLRMKELYSTMAVAYSHLYTNGFKDIALMLLSKIDMNFDEEEATYNNIGTKAKIPEALKKELDHYYNIKKNRVVGKNIEDANNHFTVSSFGIPTRILLTASDSADCSF